LKARLDRDREVLAKRLDGERASREELQGEMLKLQRQAQALENIEEMLFKERAQRQRAERSIVELARSLGTLKAALLHAGVPVPPEARPSSALQNTVQVLATFKILISLRLRLFLSFSLSHPSFSASNFRKALLQRPENVHQESYRLEHPPQLCRAPRHHWPHSRQSSKTIFLSRKMTRICQFKVVKGVTTFQFPEQTRANWKILTSSTTLMLTAAAQLLKAAAMLLMTLLMYWSSCRRNWSRALRSEALSYKLKWQLKRDIHKKPRKRS
jgi:hypothetical protein